MPYELWCGDVLLGHSALDYPQVSAITFAGEFEPAPGAEQRVRKLALAIHCMTAWLNRDTRDALGRPVVSPAFLHSRMFAAATEAITARHNPSLRLRRPDGSVIPTRHLIIQDMGALGEHIELLEEAMRADAELHADDDDDESNDDEAEEAWRGDVHPDDSFDNGDRMSIPPINLSRSYLNLHVMIEHAGDIPADTSWLTG